MKENKKELEYSKETHPQAEYILERLIGCLIVGIGFLFILLKIVDPY